MLMLQRLVTWWEEMQKRQGWKHTGREVFWLDLKTADCIINHNLGTLNSPVHGLLSADECALDSSSICIHLQQPHLCCSKQQNKQGSCAPYVEAAQQGPRAAGRRPARTEETDRQSGRYLACSASGSAPAGSDAAAPAQRPEWHSSAYPSHFLPPLAPVGHGLVPPSDQTPLPPFVAAAVAAAAVAAAAVAAAAVAQQGCGV